MRALQLLLTIAALASSVLEANAGDIKLIANPGVKQPAISRDEIARIFLMTRTSLAGAGHVEPVLQSVGRAHDLFLSQFLGRTDSALTIYYRSLVFTGKASMPRTFKSDEQVLQYVARTKGAIGYVSADADTRGVQVLNVN